MRLKHTKACYIANFGISPHFASVLNHEIRKSAIYSLSFDESLNKTTQECELDFLIRFWDETYNDVKVRYFGSSFFRHAIVEGLGEQFQEITKYLVSAKIFQASMEESNLNLKLHEALKHFQVVTSSSKYPLFFVLQGVSKAK